MESDNIHVSQDRQISFPELRYSWAVQFSSQLDLKIHVHALIMSPNTHTKKKEYSTSDNGNCITLTKLMNSHHVYYKRSESKK